MPNMYTQIVILYSILNICGTSHVTVLTTKGPVRGESKIITGEITSITFLGIPYAKPPTGKLRFQNPISTDEWTQVKTLTNSQPNCLALNSHTSLISGDEDCLYLDVYTGQMTSYGESLESNFWPVLVIFQGDVEFEVNDKQWVFKQILLIVVHYRIQILGHLTSEDNFHTAGLQDQIMALQWIHKNVIAFGGDPDQVTILGEGQTGNDVTALLFSPLAKGLFSGAGILSAPLGLTPSIDSTRVIASRVACPQQPTQETIKCLRKKDAKLLIEKQTFNMFGVDFKGGNLTFVSNVPVVIAITSSDSHFLPRVVNGEDILKVAVANFDELKDFVYSFYGHSSNVSEMVLDGVFYAPAISLAKKCAMRGETFLYELSFEQRLTTLEMFLGGSRTSLTLDERIVMGMVVTLWTNFVINGQPSLPEHPKWPPTTPTTTNCYEINLEPKVTPFCKHHHLISFWNSLHLLPTKPALPTFHYFTPYNPPKCTAAITLLTLLSITLFLTCIYMQHQKIHEKMREITQGLRNFFRNLRGPQTTEV